MFLESKGNTMGGAEVSNKTEESFEEDDDTHVGGFVAVEHVW